MKRIAGLLATLLLIAQAVQAQSRPDNFVQWRNGLASSAQPTRDWLGKARSKGFDVVVNLAPPQVHGSLPDEGSVLGTAGIDYVNIPVAREARQRLDAGCSLASIHRIDAQGGRQVSRPSLGQAGAAR
jgi:hypothetical protein